jgi:subtilisin family serine protease
MNKRIVSWAAACAVLGLAGSLAALPAQAGPKAGDRTQVVIGFKSGAGPALRAAIARAGGTVAFDMSEVDAVGANLSRKAIEALKRHPKVDFVDEGVPRQLYGSLGGKGMRATAAAQIVPYGIPMVQADQVSDASTASLKLCIIDSGIDGTHEDLQGISMTGKDFTAAGNAFSDENSHGTHVAGTIVARDNGLGVIGVAPNGQLKLHISKVFDAAGSASSLTVARGMLSCAQAGSNIVSMSLGSSVASPIEQRVVSLMARRNMLIIAAAGNAGDTSTSYPAGFAEVVSVAAVDSAMAHAGFSQSNPDVEIAAPGVAVLSTIPPGLQSEATTTVGATSYTVQAMDGSPRISATGPLADFGLGDTPVPGSMAGKVCLISRGTITFADKVLNCQTSGGVGAIIYNNVAGELFGTLGGVATTIPSVGALQADGATMLGQLGQSATVSVVAGTLKYAEFNGTSMSTPHVSAVAALVWSLHPTCTAAQIRDSLNKSAMDLGVAGRDNDFGFGLVRAKDAVDRITALGCGA